MRGGRLDLPRLLDRRVGARVVRRDFLLRALARAVGAEMGARTTLDKIDVFAINNQLRLGDALRQIGEEHDVSARVVGAVREFVAMIDTWRQAAGTDAMEESLLASPDGGVGLAELVERAIRESGLEATYKKSKLEEDEQRLANLDELVSAAAQLSPADTDDAGQAAAAGAAQPRSTLQMLQAFSNRWRW